MIVRKGSLSYSPNRSRVQTRWSALLLCVFTLLLFLYHDCFSVSYWLLPLPSQPYTVSFTSCPVTPPYPPLKAHYRNGTFNWRELPQRYPVSRYAQLSARKEVKLPEVQFDFGTGEAPFDNDIIRKRRQGAVRDAFKRCWDSYRKYAWKQDEVAPISGRAKTTFGGWGATLVDSLDTLWIMGFKEEFEEAVKAVSEIEFNPGVGELNMFETTIRYLGGLLSAYDLTDCRDTRLLEKAMQLGDMIYASFDTPNRMPITRWSAKKAIAGEEQHAAEQGILAELASFSLEFTRLSQITGDMKYYDAVVRVAAVMAEQQQSTTIPGLWPVGVNVQKPDLTNDTTFTLGTMADSAYEYLGKTYQLLQGTANAEPFAELYMSAIGAVSTNLLFRPATPEADDILMSTSARAQSDGTAEQDYSIQHLGCFAGGMFALGGRLFDNSTHVSIGRALADGCAWAYLNAPNGIMPESFIMTPCPSNSTSSLTSPLSIPPCTPSAGVQQQFPGFTHVIDARYQLRPEAIESVFYTYRVTGAHALQDTAWRMFDAINTLTRTDLANAAVDDVTLAKGEVRLVDGMESFWLAETLKYFWLVFAQSEMLDLGDWVASTEGHFFRIPRG